MGLKIFEGLTFNITPEVENDLAECLLKIIKDGGDVNLIEIFIKLGVDVKDGKALVAAVEKDRLDVAKLLIENGADASYNKCIAFYEATKNGNVKLIKLLSEALSGS